MKRIFIIACSVFMLCILAGCFASTASVSTQRPEVYISGLGGGYGLAFDPENNLYAVGKDNAASVVWKITGKDSKEVYSVLSFNDPIMSMLGVTSGLEQNMAVDGFGNIWMTSSMNGQCYVAAKGKQARIVYLNSQVSVSFDVKGDSKGVAWDADNNKLYIITSGPESSFSNKLDHHLTTLTPSAGNFAQELGTASNGWNQQPLYIEDDGIPLDQPGIGLIKAKSSLLYFIGDNQLYIIGNDGKIEKFGSAFGGLSLKGGTADDNGNLYVSANTKGNEDDGKGVIYKIDKSGKASLLLKDIGKPLGLAFNNGYLYIMEGKSGSILRLKTAS
jgi:hypothetical protein